MLKLFNYLSRKKEEFKPIGRTVGLYTCGPTVYDFAHIGNFRTFIFEDILKRTLALEGFRVKHVMNITDVDDKMIQRAKRERTTIEKLAQKYEKLFFDDLSRLNIKKADLYPKATEHIDSMIKLIVRLLDLGFAYKTEDGVFFNIAKFKDYGKLSGINTKDLKAGARVEVDQYDKANPSDFALWKTIKPSEPSWDASFGKGRPGWHIECSAMSMKYLGETFDIHAGAIDLMFPHHENEIAQSEAATGKNFVNFWMEGEHLLVDSQKMAKSADNFYLLSDIVKKGFNPLAFRYLNLTTHYRSKLNFSQKSLESAKNALNNLYDEISRYEEPKVGCAEFEDDFRKALADDLDTPKALAIMWKVIKSNYPQAAKHKTILWMDQVLGLDLDKVRKPQIATEVKVLIEKREQARIHGDWDLADMLRQEIEAKGIEIEDTHSGPKWKAKR